MAYNNVQNYFESLVFDAIRDKVRNNELENDEDLLCDVACISLNQLPARYIRHSVDAVFYMTSEERVQNETIVEDAIRIAIERVEKYQSDKRPETIQQ